VKRKKISKRRWKVRSEGIDRASNNTSLKAGPVESGIRNTESLQDAWWRDPDQKEGNGNIYGEIADYVPTSVTKSRGQFK